MRSWVFIGLVATACGAAGDESMTEKERLIAETLNFDEQTYFEMNPAVASSVAPKALDYDIEALIVISPRNIPVDQRESLPVLFVAVESGQRAQDVPLGANAVVIAANADTGAFRYLEAFPEDPSKAPGSESRGDSMKPVMPTEPPMSAEDAQLMKELGADRTASGVWLDFKELLDIPWEYGRYGLWALAYDQISNPAYVSLIEEPVTIDGFPADDALEVARDTAPTGIEDDEFPRFVASGATPAVQGNGVAIAVGEMVFDEENSILPVHASLRLPIPEQQIVAQLIEDETEAPTAEGLPSAVVRTTLLLTTKNVIPPATVTVDIPVWTDHELQKGEVVEAAFSLDLHEELGYQLKPGVYYLYLFAGAYVSPAQRVEITAAQ